MVKCLMIPESIGQNTAMPAAHRAMFWYFNTIMAPGDGPAAIAATDGRWVVAGMDRNGLRPMRYSVTEDGLLIVGSEAGMVRVPEESIRKRAGSARADDRRRSGRRTPLSRPRDQGSSGGQAAVHEWVERITQIDDLIKPGVPEAPELDETELRRRQLVYGLTMEDMELILQPMVVDAKEAVGSMGDDTPWRCCRRTIAACTTSPAELLAGDQSADRQLARDPGDVAEDPARQHSATSWPRKRGSAICCNSTARF
jgi:glutamate synthase (NADPH/NADH) large chain